MILDEVIAKLEEIRKEHGGSLAVIVFFDSGEHGECLSVRFAESVTARNPLWNKPPRVIIDTESSDEIKPLVNGEISSAY